MRPSSDSIENRFYEASLQSDEEEKRLRERLEEQKIRDGDDPDNAEFDRFRMPRNPLIDAGKTTY